MTKLEEEIAKSLPFASSIEGSEFTEVPDDYLARVAKAAAEVAKKYIEKAWSDAYGRHSRTHREHYMNEWLKENGIVE